MNEDMKCLLLLFIFTEETSGTLLATGSKTDDGEEELKGRDAKDHVEEDPLPGLCVVLVLEHIRHAHFFDLLGF